MLLLLGGIIAAGVGIHRLLKEADPPAASSTVPLKVHTRPRPIWRTWGAEIAAVFASLARGIADTVRTIWSSVKSAVSSALVEGLRHHLADKPRTGLLNERALVS